MKYQSLPKQIEAFPVPRIMDIDKRVEIEDWLTKNNADKSMRWIGNGAEINTNHGKVYAGPGDFIILSDTGEIYPCNPDEFKKRYEPV